MTPERWKEIDRLVQAALACPSEERPAFLAEACTDDEALRREVEALLAYQTQAAGFLEQPVLERAAAVLASPPEKLVAGSTLGRYQIIAPLGAGGMGEVYLARDTKLGRKVALKLLPSDFTDNAERLRRFKQEACAASALNHPNIITIHEIGAGGGTHFIATEFIEGETLRAALARGPLKLDEALAIAAQVAAALAAAHEAGIVHRDIKPENIMVRRDRIVKVLDFGLAKLALPRPAAVDTEMPTRVLVKTNPGMVLGTVQYMSPEQARGFETDARTDLWSLGCVLYELLAGRGPFARETSSDVLAAILEREPPPLAHYAPGVPTEVEGIVQKALRKDRAERYQTAEEVLTDLKRVKQRLEFAAELKRSAPPDESAAVAATTSGEHTAVETAAPAAAHPTSRAEYVAREIKRHKAAALAVLLILLLALGGLGVRYVNRRLIKTAGIESIAVLPFQNATGNSDAEYLSDGISEALINSLTELQQLKVIARTTAFRYKGREVDPQVVGRELQVRAVLTGRVRQTGDALNVQVDLVDTETGAQLWGTAYERKVADVLAVKQAIAREVTERLRLRLSGEEQARLVKRDTINPEAYRFYLSGRYYWNKRTADGLQKALGEFQQALDRDPNYALGYVGLADCYLVLESVANTAAVENLPKARAAADRALQLDDSLAEAHASSAMTFEQLWRWPEAEAEFKRAIALNPNYPTVHHWYSHYFRAKRQFDDALREIRRAEELDPLSAPISFNVAQVYLSKGDIKATIEQYKRVNELDPKFSPSVLGFALLKQQRYEEAMAAFQKGVEIFGRGSQDLSDLGYGYAVTGRRAEALRVLKELEENYAQGKSLGMYLAAVYVGLGDKEQAFAWLEKDFQQHSGTLTFVTWLVAFDDLRSDPRYADLVRRMGLAPADIST